MKRVRYSITSIYDTETCNIGYNENARAYPILFIDNDVRDIDLYNYEPDVNDKVNFYRTSKEMQARIDEYIEWGLACNVVPIICAYNLSFDVQPLLFELNKRYDMEVNAQSSTNIYTLDLYEKDSDKQLLRFWDTYHLEMRGLAAMGETCGLAKAKGDWDYSLIRSQETPLTDEELYYAKRDVQVIPAYLKYLLHANEWMKQSDLGCKILTKTSIVRQMARKEIAQLKIKKANGKDLTVDKAFISLCNKEMPKNYDIYALRKACFRGGFTFTAAKFANEVVKNVISLDVVSMHHTFINGRYIPQDFKVLPTMLIQNACDRVIDTSLDDVLKNYHKPFSVAFHAAIVFHNLRLKKGTCFSEFGIALEASAKFKKQADAELQVVLSMSKVLQENEIRSRGWYDQFDNAWFALGKLYKATHVLLHVTELELWSMSRVYDWDSYEVLYGESTMRFKKPPDYVVMQSNKLFEMKSKAKIIANNYIEGEAYSGNLDGIPDGIAEGLRNGTLSAQFFQSWYTNTIKGMFNGIYGTMAQDVYKPGYIVKDGVIGVNHEDVCTPENFKEKTPRNSRVLFTYGMRIVGGSRMHLVIAMELLWNKFKEKVRVTGGDTDSVKCSVDVSISDDMIEEALNPLKEASKKAIDFCMIRLRETFPDIASTLDDIGSFEIENRNGHYKYHMEAWNKARISYDNRAHVTCAGLQRPIGQFHIESFLDALINAGYDVETVFKETLGYNVFVSNSICHSLEAHRPKVTDIYDYAVIDYLGKVSFVNEYESNALYSVGRWLGETTKLTNRLSVHYLQTEYGKQIDTNFRYLYYNDGKVTLQRTNDAGVTEIIMEVKDV